MPRGTNGCGLAVVYEWLDGAVWATRIGGIDGRAGRIGTADLCVPNPPGPHLGPRRARDTSSGSACGHRCSYPSDALASLGKHLDPGARGLFAGRAADREEALDGACALTRASAVVETGVDPVTYRFSGGRSAD